MSEPKITIDAASLNRVVRERDEAQQQEAPPLLLLPDLQKVAPDKPVSYYETACRDLLCAMIQQAVEDTDPTEYQDRGKNSEAAYDLASALEFIRHPFFAALCEELHLPTDKIRRRAFK